MGMARGMFFGADSLGTNDPFVRTADSGMPLATHLTFGA